MKPLISIDNVRMNHVGFLHQIDWRNWTLIVSEEVIGDVRRLFVWRQRRMSDKLKSRSQTCPDESWCNVRMLAAGCLTVNCAVDVTVAARAVGVGEVSYSSPLPSSRVCTSFDGMQLTQLYSMLLHCELWYGSNWFASSARLFHMYAPSFNVGAYDSLWTVTWNMSDVGCFIKTSTGSQYVHRIGLHGCSRLTVDCEIDRIVLFHQYEHSHKYEVTDGRILVSPPQPQPQRRRAPTITLGKIRI